MNNKTIAVKDSAIEKILSPVTAFLRVESSAGIILIIVTVISLIWANSVFGDYYIKLWNTSINLGFGAASFEKPLILLINDGLMAVFFFVVGLEIKREILIGELTSLKKSSFPVFAALGGMIVPALIFVFINNGTGNERGWGIPMATDIAFSLGILALLGKRVPVSLKIFLTAFAIIDDIGAVLVIALFYTEKIYFVFLLIVLACLLVLVGLNLLHARRPAVYAVFGFIMWIACFNSGIHPTIAGILLAFTIPAKARIDRKEFVKGSREILKEIEDKYAAGENSSTGIISSKIYKLEKECERVTAPAYKIEHALHPYVAYFIIPLFALSNAGVVISGNIFESLTHPLSFGIITGLFAGKLIGISLFSWLACKTGISDLPSGVSWRQIFGVACLGGIGFTMSLFISSLAFQDAAQIGFSKIGILSGSLISGITGVVILLFGRKEKPMP